MFSNKKLMNKDRSKLLVIIDFIFGINILNLKSIKLRTIFSFIILFIIFIFVIFYFRYTFETQYLDEKKKEGVSIANMLFKVIQKNISFNRPIKDNQKLSRIMDSYLKTLRILKLKMYDQNGKTLYSSFSSPSEEEKKHVIKVLTSNKTLVVIEKRKDQFENSSSKVIQYLEVYHPTKLGVFAIYQDITDHVHSYQKWGIILFIVIILAIGSVSVILALVFHQIKTRENELICQKELAEEANRSKDNFLARVSHEIKNPLNGILGFGELAKIRFEEVKEGLLSHSASFKQAQEDNATILECGKAINRFIDDLTYFSNIKEGQLQLLLENIDFQEIIQSLNSFVNVTNKNKEVFININYDQNIKYIFSDKIRLNQVLNNLISNAIKFTKKGQININFSKLNENDTLIITISDTGIGFSKDEAKRVFDEFYQVEHKSTYEGLGLGLAIVKQLVALLKGEVQVESEKNGGSTFTLILPHHIY